MISSYHKQFALASPNLFRFFVVVYGELYNWYTATAGSGTQSGVTGGKDAPMSICPSAGKTTVDTTTNAPYAWKLPPNTGDGSYTNLFLTKAGFVTTTDGTNPTFVNTIQAEPYGFVLAGWYDSVIRYLSEESVAMTRTSVEGGGSNYDSRSYNFTFFGAGDRIGEFALDRMATSLKHLGRAVRCVRYIKCNFRRIM